MKAQLQGDRGQALAILVEVLQQHTPLSHLLRKPQLSSMTKALCFGVIRYFVRLDLLAKALVPKPPKDIKLWLTILLGLYQLDSMTMPEYAVVQETVGLVSPSWARGLVNAVLRRFCRERNALYQTLTTNIAFQSNHPTWLAQKIQAAWPDDWQAIFAANDSHPPLSLRVNLCRQSRAQYCATLDQKGLAYRILPQTAGGLILEKPCNVEEIPGFREGCVSVQDGAAQLAGELLDLAPHLRVLDACCAPGGKICQILELASTLTSCVGLDIDSRRLARVEDNSRRLALLPSLAIGDATQVAKWWDGVPFDRILVDAPCSATGIIRRQPDIKLLRTPAEITALVRVQGEILKALWPLLASGGILLYATCSIMPEENAQQIMAFMGQHPDAELDASIQAWGRWTGYGWQILPQEQDMDGFFYAKIRKSA